MILILLVVCSVYNVPVFPQSPRSQHRYGKMNVPFLVPALMVGMSTAPPPAHTHILSSANLVKVRLCVWGLKMFQGGCSGLFVDTHSILCPTESYLKMKDFKETLKSNPSSFMQHLMELGMVYTTLPTTHTQAISTN